MLRNAINTNIFPVGVVSIIQVSSHAYCAVEGGKECVYYDGVLAKRW